MVNIKFIKIHRDDTILNLLWFFGYEFISVLVLNMPKRPDKKLKLITNYHISGVRTLCENKKLDPGDWDIYMKYEK